MDPASAPPDRRDRPPIEGVLGYESTCAAGWTRSKSSFSEMLSVSAVMSTTLPSRILHKEGVGVFVGLAVNGDAAPVPQDDHCVPVGVD